jgi:nucleoid-associated protein EbfC
MAKGFPGMPGMNMQGLVQQAQKMKKQLEDAQLESEKYEDEGSAAGGLVVARANGRGDLLSLEIDPKIVDPNDVKFLADAVVCAVNNALSKVKEYRESRMAKITGGVNLPGFY